MRKAKVDHATFLSILSDRFPEVRAAFDGYSDGLLHCQMGTFAQVTEEAIDNGRLWQVEQYFRLVDEVRCQATPDVENAIDVSYIEFLAFSEHTEARYQAFKRMPVRIREILLQIDGRSRWVSHGKS